jgi:multidrug efflux system membrane fusion protein
VANASHRDVPLEIQVIGNVEAYSTITVKAQVGGQLVNVYFKEGDFVKKARSSSTSIHVRWRPPTTRWWPTLPVTSAALLQAQANMARDEANAKYQDAQAKRYAELFKAGVISKDQAEQLRASADASAQAVAADQAAIASAQAAIGASTATAENAKVQLGFTTIYSPINGAPATSPSNRAT